MEKVLGNGLEFFDDLRFPFLRSRWVSLDGLDETEYELGVIEVADTNLWESTHCSDYLHEAHCVSNAMRPSKKSERNLRRLFHHAELRSNYVPHRLTVADVYFLAIDKPNVIDSAITTS